MIVDRRSAVTSRTGRARTAGSSVGGVRSIARMRAGFHPVAWLRAYPIVTPTLLVALTALMYMLQVNQNSLLDFQLQNLQVERTFKAGRYANYAAEYDHLTSCQYVCTIAVKRFNMDHPNLTSALWINVELPRRYPVLPRARRTPTGPMVWVQNALVAVRNSL